MENLYLQAEEDAAIDFVQSGAVVDLPSVLTCASVTEADYHLTSTPRCVLPAVGFVLAAAVVIVGAVIGGVGLWLEMTRDD